MSCANIELLESLVYSTKEGGKNISDSLDQIKRILDDVSCGIGSDARHRCKLQNNILKDLEKLTGGELRHKITKVINRIRRERREIAENFYSAHHQNHASIDAINFDFEPEILKLSTGMILYQWCIPVIDKYSTSKDGNPEAFLDKKGSYICLGSFYSPSIVEIEFLGASALIDIWFRGNYLGTGTRELYQFRLPFNAYCLKSVAGSAFDSWSARRNWDGSEIAGQGFLMSGGAVQYFLPLNKEQKMRLAETGEKIR